jgi:hypothetical protein
MAKKYNEIEVKNNMDVKNDSAENENAAEGGERKALKNVLTVEPTKVKKNLLSRLVAGVVGPEGLPGIGAYVNDEIVKPAIKNIIVDAVTSGINMVMYGEKGGAPRQHGRQAPYSSGRSNYRPNTNYTSNYRSAPEPARADDRNVHVRAARNTVEEYIIPDRFDATNVLTTLVENADMYNSVSVADYYDLIGVATKYTDNNFGWTIDSIAHAMVVPVRNGFTIKFPPVEVI